MRNTWSNNAFIFDLKDAFNQVTPNLIAAWLKLYMANAPKKIIDIFVDLLVFRGNKRE